MSMFTALSDFSAGETAALFLSRPSRRKTPQATLEEGFFGWNSAEE